MREEQKKNLSKKIYDFIDAFDKELSAWEAIIPKISKFQTYSSKASPSDPTPNSGVRGWICPACGRGNAPWNQTCPCTIPQSPFNKPTDAPKTPFERFEKFDHSKRNEY